MNSINDAQLLNFYRRVSFKILKINNSKGQKFTWPAKVWNIISKKRRPADAVYVRCAQSLCEPAVTPKIPQIVRIKAENQTISIKFSRLKPQSLTEKNCDNFCLRKQNHNSIETKDIQMNEKEHRWPTSLSLIAQICVYFVIFD